MSNTSLLVFPAHAGVIRADAVWSHPDGRFPRTRGGDSYWIKTDEHTFSFSPHARG